MSADNFPYVVTVQTEDGKKIWCGESRKELYRAL